MNNPATGDLIVMVQLSPGKTREGARRFYERLGFIGSHEGYKLKL